MGFLSIAALVLLSLVGYSSGCVLAAQERRPALGLADLAGCVGVWVGALISRLLLGRWWAIAVGLGLGLALGLLSGLVRRDRWPPREGADHSERAHSDRKRLWARWQAFSIRLGDLQGRILLAWFYWCIVTPFGLAVRLFDDPLHTRNQGDGARWLERALGQADLDRARKQF